MKWFHRNFCLGAMVAVVFLTGQLLAANTNTIPGVTQDEMVNNFLQIQEQLHATQLALEQAQLSAADQTRSNADLLAARLQAVEQLVGEQRSHEAEAARQSQQTTLFIAGIFGLAGLGIVLLLVYLQWRALAQVAQLSAQQNTAMANAGLVQQLAAPGRATVEASSARLLDVIGQLERRINELESGQRLLPGVGQGNAVRPPESLLEGQQHLNADQPAKALEFYDRYLAGHPDNPEAVVKKAEALEKLGRNAEALNCYEQALQIRNRKKTAEAEH